MKRLFIRALKNKFNMAKEDAIELLMVKKKSRI
jgi:hypothetical protein